MRRAAKVDANQHAIVEALRAVGASVLPMHALGGGAPDLAVGFQGRTLLIEIKDDAQPPSKRRLTPDEEAFHAGWNGELVVVTCIDEALAAVGATKRD